MTPASDLGRVLAKNGPRTFGIGVVHLNERPRASKLPTRRKSGDEFMAHAASFILMMTIGACQILIAPGRPRFLIAAGPGNFFGAIRSTGPKRRTHCRARSTRNGKLGHPPAYSERLPCVLKVSYAFEDPGLDARYADVFWAPWHNRFGNPCRYPCTDSTTSRGAAAIIREPLLPHNRSFPIRTVETTFSSARGRGDLQARVARIGSIFPTLRLVTPAVSPSDRLSVHDSRCGVSPIAVRPNITRCVAHFTSRRREGARLRQRPSSARWLARRCPTQSVTSQSLCLATLASKARLVGFRAIICETKFDGQFTARPRLDGWRLFAAPEIRPRHHYPYRDNRSR